ncbi:uncharacterized protein LOC141691154 [Apium graveolens]|uniref:uncharacterized protein LOC141691154 n=1 Tax=Apium graveolens TaxID=4045 RepID=UPI003D7BF004
MNHKHGKWVEFLQEYAFVIKHKAWVENKAVDALSRVIYVLNTISMQVMGFEKLKDEYLISKDFRDVYNDMTMGRHQELHGRGHFGRDKTISMVEEKFYWPGLEHDVAVVVAQCRTCQMMAKGTRKNTGLYMHLHIPNGPSTN